MDLPGDARRPRAAPRPRRPWPRGRASPRGERRLRARGLRRAARPPPGSPLAAPRRRRAAAGWRSPACSSSRASRRPRAATSCVTDLLTAQRLLGRSGPVDRVDIVLDAGSRPRRRPAPRDPRQRSRPGSRSSRPTAPRATADRMVRAFRFNLNALGSLTLLVGMFLIANAVSISVLRRRPEIATLRSIGASRAMLFGSFSLEGLAVGAAGTALGEVGGIFLSKAALRAVAGNGDGRLPADGEDRRGGLRRGRRSLGRRRDARGAGGHGAAGRRGDAGRARARDAAGLDRGPPAAEPVGPGSPPRPCSLGAAAAAVGGAAGRRFPALRLRRRRARRRSARAARRPCSCGPPDRAPRRGPLARLFGAPGRLGSRFFGGSLARNAISVTALAMALGMTLAMIVTVSSIRETVRVWVESTLRSDLWVKSPAGASSGIVGDLPEDIADFLRAIPGVAAVDPFRARDQVDARGRPYTLASGDFRVVARIGGLPLLDGRDAGAVADEARRRGEALVSEPYARRFGVRARGRHHDPDAAGPAAACASPASIATTRTTAGTVVLDRELYLALLRRPAGSRASPCWRRPASTRRTCAGASSAAATRPLRAVDLDQSRAAPRGPPDLRSDVRRDARARGDRRRRRRPRNRQRARRVGDRAAPLLRPAPRDRGFVRADPAGRAARGRPDGRDRLHRGARRRRGLRFSADRRDQPAVLRLDGRAERAVWDASPRPWRSSSPPRSSRASTRAASPRPSIPPPRWRKNEARSLSAFLLPPDALSLRRRARRRVRSPSPATTARTPRPPSSGGTTRAT